MMSIWLPRSVAVGIMLWGFSQLGTIVANEWIVLETGGHWQFLTIQGYIHVYMIFKLFNLLYYLGWRQHALLWLLD